MDVAVDSSSDGGCGNRRRQCCWLSLALGEADSDGRRATVINNVVRRRQAGEDGGESFF